MAFDESLALRTREIIAEHGYEAGEKRMFGGLCFLVDGKMLVGVESGRLMVRLDPELYEEALTKEGCGVMDFNGKPMRGYVFVDLDALNTKKKLEYWIKLALDYNGRAKSSKKEATRKKRRNNGS